VAEPAKRTIGDQLAEPIPDIESLRPAVMGAGG